MAMTTLNEAEVKETRLIYGLSVTRSAQHTPSSVNMSISVGGGESYPGRSFSVSQLLYAAKKKLEGSTLAGRCVHKVI